MRKNTIQLILIISLSFFWCQAQTDLLKVENHLKGDIDYTHESLDLVQTQKNGKEIVLGKINTDGTIHFNLPEFDIKALYDSIPLQNYDLHQLFNIDSSCKDRDIFAETPYDDVYSQKYKLMIRKYGIDVAILEPKSEERILGTNTANSEGLTTSSKYFWFYIDRTIAYKENCSKENSSTGNIYANISTDIKFEKGWNFIEENTVSNSNNDSNNPKPISIHYSKLLPSDKRVQWTLRQIQEDEKIQIAKSLDAVTPLTEIQFEKWAPKKLGDLALTKKEYGNPPARQKNKNIIHLVYADKSQKKEIKLYVIDAAKSPIDMEMVNFAYAMENNGKDEKDIKPYISQYSEREKITQLFYKLNDRLIVNASGTNLNGEELWKYIQKLNVAELLK